MGEQFIEKQTRRARCLRDQAFERELMQEKLFSQKREVYSTEFTGCNLDPSRPIRPGEALLREENGGSLELIQDSTVRARVERDSISILREGLASDARAGGCMLVEVTAAPGIGGYFSFRCAEDGN